MTIRVDIDSQAAHETGRNHRLVIDRNYEDDVVTITAHNVSSMEGATVIVGFDELTQALRMIGIGEHEARA